MSRKVCAVAVPPAGTVVIAPEAVTSLIAVPLFGQRWEPWRGRMLGLNSLCTVHDYGCAVTATAMVLHYYGVETDPGEMNEWLKANGGFSRERMLWAIAANRGNGVTFAVEQQWPDGEADLNLINNELDAGYPVIAQCRLPYQRTKRHFVVLTGRWGPVYSINDPWYGDQTSFNDRYDDPARSIYGIRVYHGSAPSSTAGEYQKQWTCPIPSNPTGTVWMMAVPRPENRYTRHLFRADGKPREYGMYVWFNGAEHASFVFAEPGDPGAPLTVTVEPECFLSFGTGSPPEGDVLAW
jgi:peptidase C39-like protein